MPHAHNLVLCVDIENTLKILTPHAHNLVLCVDIENTLKILKNTHALKLHAHKAGTVCRLLKIPLKYSKILMPHAHNLCTVCRY